MVGAYHPGYVPAGGTVLNAAVGVRALSPEVGPVGLEPTTRVKGPF